MKTLILLLTASLSLSLTACATDDESYRTGNPGRPDYKPELAGSLDKDTSLPDDMTGIDTSIDPGTPVDPRKDVKQLDDGAWVEDVVLGGQSLTLLHHGNGRVEILALGK